MKITKLSNISQINPSKSNIVRKTLFSGSSPQKNKDELMQDYAVTVDKDLINIFSVMQGRVRFGSGVTSSTAVASGENIDGEFRVFNATTTTVSASATTEFTIAHSIGAIPIGFFVVSKNNLGDIYMKSASATSATFVSSSTSTQYQIFILR